MNTENTENGQNGQGKDAKKVLASYEQIIKKATAIVKGPENLKLPKKVALKTTDYDLVADLFKEEKEALHTEVKEGLKTLIKNKMLLDQSLAAERKKLDALEVSKKKEFNAAASALFAKIDGLDEIFSGYTGAFTEAATAATAEEEEEKE